MKASHRHTQESIPWLVNGRIDDSQCRALEAHIGQCDECREELQLQQRIHAAMTHEPSRVDYAPGGSLQKLWSRIGNGEEGIATRPPKTIETTSPARQVSRLRFTHWLMAAVVVEAIGITFLATRSVDRSTANVASPAYRTVTTTEIVPQNAVLRVVFAADLTLNNMNALLRTQQLTIVAGPTSGGVYTLATTIATQEIPNTLPNTLARLRSHPGVLFAEPIGRGLEHTP